MLNYNIKECVCRKLSRTFLFSSENNFIKLTWSCRSKVNKLNSSEIVSSMVNGHVVKKDKNFKNMSGPIQFDKSYSGWQHNFSGLSHNSSSSKVGVKDNKRTKLSNSKNRRVEQYPEDANREIMKKITSDNKYFAILKKITQDSGRHNTYSESKKQKSKPSQINEEKKDYEVIDSSGGTQDNLLDLGTTQKSNQRMYGTEKIDMKKYNNLISQGPIMIEGDKGDSDNSDPFTESKIEYPLQPGKALKLFMNKLSDYEKSEILDYKSIYFLGIGSEKINGSPLNEHNYGYDDERGDYNVKMGDHIAFRFEVIEFLGKGSFGQALK